MPAALEGGTQTIGIIVSKHHDEDNVTISSHDGCYLSFRLDRIILTDEHIPPILLAFYDVVT